MDLREASLKSGFLRLSIALSLAAGLSGCDVQTQDGYTSPPPLKSSVKYAERFDIVERGSYRLVLLFGNRQNRDTTSKFVLYRDTCPLVKGAAYVKVPCRRIAALSSIYSAMLCELGQAQSIAAIDNIDYANHPLVVERYRRGELVELLKGPEPDVEGAIGLRPDMLFTFGMGDGKGTAERKFDMVGLHYAVSVDHLERTPLARAEWIKFIAAFVDKLPAADSIFGSVEERYQSLKHIAASANERPTVFSEIKFGDVWYMPGGQSFMATLFRDAGADYLWKDNEEFGSLPLSFEEVYQKARGGKFWINVPLVNSKAELLRQDARYAHFSAFKNDRIYNNTLHVNKKGYSDYWETGMIHPERILSDLIRIFHPEKREAVNDSMHYYLHLR